MRQLSFAFLQAGRHIARGASDLASLPETSGSEVVILRRVDPRRTWLGSIPLRWRGICSGVWFSSGAGDGSVRRARSGLMSMPGNGRQQQLSKPSIHTRGGRATSQRCGCRWRSLFLSALPGRVAINTGGGAFTDASGVVYAVDTTSSPHPTLTGNSTTSAIGGTGDDALYQSYRYGTDFGYNVALASGDYTVQFQFMEPWATGAGQRVFDVLLEGQEVIGNLDLFTVAGKKQRLHGVQERDGLGRASQRAP